MELKKIKHYARRTFELGPKASFSLVHNRIKSTLVHNYWRLKAINKQPFHSWQTIIKKHHKELYKNFNQFWKDQKTRLDLCVDDLKLTVEDKIFLSDAQEYAHTIFSILGSSKKQYSTIPWHSDIRLQEMDPLACSTFDPNVYYKDITITAGSDNFVKDIKVPWELSRLQHFFVLGYAYYHTHDELYAKSFVDHYTDWLAHNNFLLGANWSCPMDVGIRSVNLVWALSLFKGSKNLSHKFLEKITVSLYDHLFYLEHNWEMYDDLRSSNHYLSDLIGYFYICYFFYELPGIPQKAQWCYEELLKEFEKQIFDDGTDYEGSTSYHLLITEIFYHFYTLGKKMGFVFEQKFVDKLGAMFSFIDWCTPTNGSSRISIGDNDSGKILHYGLSVELIEGMKKPASVQREHFRDFGLSIVKTDEIHYSLRHHVYHNRQPSGHFHNDFGSITLAIGGIEIFVDSGSYLYTPSALWRNRFRSAQAHSTFFLQECEPVEFNEHLFDLTVPEQTFLESWIVSEPWTLKTSHTLYKKMYGLIAQRTVAYDQEMKSVKISDLWNTENVFGSMLQGCWNFVLNPELMVEKTKDFFVISHHGRQIAVFQSTLNFEIKDCYVSLAYGSKISSKRLEALVPLHNDPVVSTITVLV